MASFKKKIIISKILNTFLSSDMQEYFSWLFFYNRQFNSLKVSPWETLFALPLIFLTLAKIFLYCSTNDWVFNYLNITPNHITNLKIVEIFSLSNSLLLNIFNLVNESLPYKCFSFLGVTLAFLLKTLRVYRERKIYRQHFHEEAHSNSASLMQKLAFSSVGGAKAVSNVVLFCAACLNVPLAIEDASNAFFKYEVIDEYLSNRSGRFTDYQWRYHIDNMRAYKELKKDTGLNVYQIDNLSDSFAKNELPPNDPEHKLGKLAYERTGFCHANDPNNMQWVEQDDLSKMPYFIKPAPPIEWKKIPQYDPKKEY